MTGFEGQRFTPRERAICTACHIAVRHGCTLTEVLGRSRFDRVVRPRHEAFLALSERGWSLTRIGRLFGRDHSTVAHGLAKARERQGWLFPEWRAPA